MGTDLFTSSRGPGLIGTLMAALVLVGFGTLYFLVFDKSMQGGGQTIESVIKDQGKSIVALQKQIKSGKETVKRYAERRRVAADLEDLTHEATRTTSRLNETQGLVDSAKTSLSEIEGLWADYKVAYRRSERAAAKGETMDRLVTTSGKTYQNVKITDVDALRMQIRHSGGITGIPMEVLPTDLQDRFQYDADEAAQKQLAEKERVDRNRIGFSIGDLKVRISNLEYENQEASAKVVKLEKRYDQARSAIPSLERQLEAKKVELDRDLLKRSSRTETGRTGVSRAPMLREQMEAISRKLAMAERAIPLLTASIDAEKANIEQRRGTIGELQQKIEELKTKAAAEKKDP